MGCSKQAGQPGYQRKKSGELYSRPVPDNLKIGPLQLPEEAEIVCIKTEKVYESCKKVETNEEVTDLTGIAVGEIEDVWCIDVELVIDEEHPFTCEKISNTNRARVSFWFYYRFAYIDQGGQKFFTSQPVFFEKTVILSDRIFDKRLFVQCEVFLDCFECFVSGPQQVTCCIGKLILVKLVALVQLLVPSYGFCPEPDFCTQIEAECPDFEPEWPPFPPQSVPTGD
ncbi:MAG: hypothetical protein WAQ32_05660 [Dethiobacteria bacterium]|jgi:hypothetical protein|nr:hypothetical protein [Bacillota bacterium]NMD33979.1 hypothetical protein [Bacillota bacterium]HOB28713.1 hypothetical protein [Bacillota bacterium]HPZ41401.1 hypothetical protein [Bacillota bacterium]HQD51668.1 hypothetical protein [Bacillota bacterium]